MRYTFSRDSRIALHEFFLATAHNPVHKDRPTRKALLKMAEIFHPNREYVELTSLSKDMTVTILEALNAQIQVLKAGKDENLSVEKIKAVDAALVESLTTLKKENINGVQTN